jgi:hypothetical protein
MNDENMPLSEYVKSRFDHINTQLDTLTREVRAVHRQATKTNGRVNQLETKAEVAKAVGLVKTEIATNERITLRWRINLAFGAASLLLGGLIGNLIHPGAFS